VTGHYDSDHSPDTPEYNDFVAYAVEVTVDRETGAFTIDDVVMAADIGTVIIRSRIAARSTAASCSRSGRRPARSCASRTAAS
jgi:CO/xanthine dehydrogenase Mo-binding subunit